MSATFRAETAPLFFITASQVLLAQAEAIELGWISGQTTANAQAKYESGITKILNNGDLQFRLLI